MFSKSRLFAIFGASIFFLMVPLTAMAQKDVLVIGTTDRITELSPANSYDYWTWHTFEQTSDWLVTLEPRTTKIIPSLAKSWEVSPDGKVYTFHLRSGVTFTDGEPFNAHAMKWALERNLRLDGPKGAVGLIKGIIERIEAVDDLTLRITIKNPDATFLARLSSPNTPAMAISPKSTPADEFANGRYAGTGPYRIVEYIPEERVVYEAYDKYWGPKPKIKRIIEVFYADATALRAAVESGEVDIGFRTFNPEDILDLKKNPNLNVIIGENSPGTRYNLFNITQPPFNNIKVRQAIAYAVDRDAICQKVFGGLNEPVYTMVPFWSSINVFPERDLNRARQLLREAGYSESNKLKITLWYTPKHYGTTEADVAAVEKASLEETGMIDVKIEVLEWGAYVQRMSEGGLGFFFLGWYPDYIDPDNYLAPWLTDSPESLGTFFNKYERYPEYKKLLDEAKATTDVAKRTEIYQKVQKMTAEDVPFIPLWRINDQHVAITKKNVKGIVLDASMDFRNWLVYKE
ncbi:MAG: ABC transporter substrate-binding protein [bacterium]